MACKTESEEQPRSATNAYQTVTGDSAEEDRGHWDALYNRNTGYVYGKEPATFLRDHLAAVPRGRALDIAMGEGRNAVFLAKKGFQVDGVDLSEVAIRKAKRLARENQVSISTINADLTQYQIKADTYDLIVNINYLQRTLVPGIKRGLKRGGYLIYETFTMDHLKNPAGKSFRRDYLLHPGELRELFSDLELVHYHESNDGKEAKASLVARKK